MSRPKLEELQAYCFGRNFAGATLSNFRCPGGFSPQKIADWINTPKGFLILTGPAGTGKTYFCSAVLEYVIDRPITLRAWRERSLFEKLREGIASGHGGDYLYALRQYADDQLLIIDDVGSSGNNAWREEILLELVDYRYYEDLPTIITTNLSKEMIKATYHERIASRLFGSKNLHINMEGMPDLRQLGL